jgi:hypothetical protein
LLNTHRRSSCRSALADRRVTEQPIRRLGGLHVAFLQLLYQPANIIAGALLRERLAVIPVHGARPLVGRQGVIGAEEQCAVHRFI